ncbi:MAG: ATP-dependent DNA helicase RecG [Burkholderiaceae bacterium]|nr:ATP-dependent DNA helicase RecG [Pseudomonadota bacterium]MBS0598390.1 ATP-dependent DNA helicase RecG [Pseudomonadota bacterium]MCO5116989.1 ATP-dependent DNA helicase RecG [Burkholderiaceae bacterium]MCP5216699.1 ATP-dependent DNA helicase RecG [Burkholderiaceae bacterium]
MPDAQAPPAQPLSAPQKALHKLGLVRPIDLALHLPLRWEDETRLTPLAEAARVLSHEPVQFEATVVHQEVAYRPRRQLLVTVEDGGERCVLRFFNFYPSQLRQLAVGARLRLRGELRGGFGGLTMMHPTVHAAGGALPAALTPVYPTVAQLPQAYLRKAVQAGLAQADLGATLPAEFSSQIDALRPWDLRQALTFLHHPAAGATLSELQDHSHPAWQRLKAEELLAQQLSQWKARIARQQLRAPAMRPAPGGLPEQLLAALPFALTGAQRRVGEEIARDLARTQPMHRLLQGDVGSGKTVVAALAACVAIDAGWQCALMAPTEILAEQHFAKLAQWLAPLLAARGQAVAWLTGSQKKKERAPMLAAIESGAAALVIGTHAVIQAQVKFAHLGLAVIDEQHRFGVEQRLALRNKLSETEREPHLLMMSATPIPRTLAMSYYADLDVSTLDELPPGRTPVLTKLLAEHRRDELVERLRAQIAEGRQVYWVCPLIEESEALDLRHASQTHEELSAALPGACVGLLHARLPPADKKAVMAEFVAGRIDVLVSTTVIEVGVDVPNASVMVIEHAERFGLSQLHQLRGRVGRGAAASACVLLYSVPEGGRLGETARARLKAMLETSDGFEIARRDLAIRGPGEFLGARQSGDALLRFADLAEDGALLQWARAAAPAMWARYPEDAARHVERWLGARADYLKA